MRYALRNQTKIQEKLGLQVLRRILQSLDAVFTDIIEVPITPSEEEYPLLIINDITENEKSIQFYVLGITYDVVRIAFKQII